uniref:Uncharacterized protein n=1 Tax=Plectus sambesii TaxID=2011161 RepID=A0A914UHD2_9BILA
MRFFVNVALLLLASYVGKESVSAQFAIKQEDCNTILEICMESIRCPYYLLRNLLQHCQANEKRSDHRRFLSLLMQGTRIPTGKRAVGNKLFFGA